MEQKIKVTVFGARGYTGLETCRCLLKHPNVSEMRLISRNADWKLSTDLPQARENLLTYTHPEEFENVTDLSGEVVFLALSATDAFKWAPVMAAKGAKVIDLSGAHRLSAEDAQTNYGLNQTDKTLTDEAIYGLVPFANVKGSIVSNPGCYVSSVLMSLIPLLKKSLIRTDNIVIDSKSGTSGAGRKPADITNFSELCEEVQPYKIGNHQHYPEIIRYAKYFADKDIQPRFTTTLLPIKRGILSTMYLQTTPEVSTQDIHNAFEGAFAEYPFVKVYELTGNGDESYKLALRNVLHTNFTQIAFHLDGEKLTVFSMIDNLMKGAAGQAVENMNLMFGLPVDCGL